MRRCAADGARATDGGASFRNTETLVVIFRRRTLDIDAMSCFFPQANLAELIRNMKQPDNANYNATFTYPQGGAIEYVRVFLSEVNAQSNHESFGNV